MHDRPLFERATFWVAMGGAVAAIGGIVMGVGVAQVVTQSNSDLWVSSWFDVGLGTVVVGAAMLVWAIVLYTADKHIERRALGAKPTPVLPAVTPTSKAQATSASPTMIARPYGMTLHPQSDIDINVVRHHWMKVGDKQSLVVDVQIHNTSATWPRTIKRHRWEFASGVPSVYRDELVVQLKGSSLTVGPIDPSQNIEGMISCQISAEPPKPAFELYVEDDLGRESKAGP